MRGVTGQLYVVTAPWRKLRGLFMGMALLFALLVPSSAAMAICAGPPGSGDWTNTDRNGSPYWIRIELIGCGDVSLNGAPPSPTRTGVRVWVKQSHSSLYQRPRVEGQVRGGIVTARVPTGGYVDVMTMRQIRVNGRDFLDVDILHESLDSKPGRRSRYRFERGHIKPTLPVIVSDRIRLDPRATIPRAPATPGAPGSPGSARPPATSFYGTGDWDGDGNPDIVVRKPNGDLFLYPGESRRGYSDAQPIQIGNGWSDATFYGMGDWDKDGHVDLVVRKTNGNLYLYPGESRRGYSRVEPVEIGNGWNDAAFFGMGDWDGDGNLDLVMRKANGDLFLYPGESRRGYS